MSKQNTGKAKKRNGRNKAQRNMERGYRLTSQSMYSSFQSKRTTGLDPHMYVTLKYAAYVSNTVASGVATVHTMNLNSCFDPDRTGVGTQPYGWDQYSALYNRYRVLRTGWKVSFVSTTGTWIAFVVPVNGLLNTAPTTAQTFADCCMNPRAKTCTIGLNAEPEIVRGVISLNELNGVTRTEYLGDDRFEAAVTGSPTEIMTLAIGFFNQTAGSLGLNCFIEMYFDVDLHDPIYLPAS